MPQKTRWTDSSYLHGLCLVAALLILSACSVPRPNTDICIANAPANHLICYNLKKDYDNDGNRNPNAKPSYKPLTTVEDINKFACTDPDGLAELKIYLQDLRERFKDCH